MPSSSVSEIFFLPAFSCLFLIFIIALINVFVGINIHPQHKRQKDLHRYLYYAVVAGYLIFLAINYSQSNWIEYAVLLYLLIIVPWTRGVNATQHAILSSLGLVLLAVMALKQI